MSKVDEFEAIVIGTGFGGAVTACRLVEAGFRICILERGRRYGPADFPKYPTGDLFAPQEDSAENYAPPPDFSRWLWSQDHGIYDIRDLDDAVSVQAAGYGGGSLIYANVHLRPPRKVFKRGWPEEYDCEQNGQWILTPYFDLAAYMLGARPIPVQLAKTLRMQEAAAVLRGSPANHWFRTPLAVNFADPEQDADAEHINHFDRKQKPCDMRGRCWQGCDRQAKNTLDLNYLARAEDGDPKPDIRTLAEVTGIEIDEQGMFTVTYTDLLLRGDDEWRAKLTGEREVKVRAKYVFLCAGSVHTTELLLKNPRLWGTHQQKSAKDTPVGSHYFPNADSFSVVFDCKTAHEADYGPTITSALLYQEPVETHVHCSLDFYNGFCRSDTCAAPAAGTTVRGMCSGATAVLLDAPILDWGGWRRSATGAVGALVLIDQTGTFAAGEPLKFGDGQAMAIARSTAVAHEHWFVAEDGGYPPDLAPLINVFRSPLWLRRNRFLEPLATARPRVPPQRPTAQHLRVQAFVDALGGTSRRAVSSEGLLARRYNSNSPGDTTTDPAGAGQARLGHLETPVGTLFPTWFVTAIKNDRQELFEQAATFALPLLSRLLDDLSKTLSAQIDADKLSALGVAAVDRGVEKDVLIRGMLRQVLQVVAGSEVAIANKVASLFIECLPGNSEGLLKALGDLALWALAYGSNEGNTGLILTMGRDLYRGKLDLVHDGRDAKTVRLRARLSSRLVDTSSVAQERVLRAIAAKWEGELRTNPTWTTLGQRVTVHSQGGCPMGSDEEHSVTAPTGQVHGCPGLYVMDAAAFPTSVGVNPSATIAAVAEYKVERFIQATKDPDWAARDHPHAQQWVDKYGRALIDPLRLQPHATTPPANVPVLGMTFDEKMEGFLSGIGEEPIDWEDLARFPEHIHRLVEAEDAGVEQGFPLTMTLHACVPDLAQHVARGSTTNPMKIEVEGTVEVDRRSGSVIKDQKQSYLQFFVRLADDTTPPVRFFRYKIAFECSGQIWTINGLKVLRDQPGFDIWQDTSALYFELSGGDGPRRGGVLRLSANHFITKQLTSMTITGTKDPARCSWALAAFYKYFIGELVTVYGSRAARLKGSLWKVLTEIHV